MSRGQTGLLRRGRCRLRLELWLVGEAELEPDASGTTSFQEEMQRQAGQALSVPATPAAAEQPEPAGPELSEQQEPKRRGTQGSMQWQTQQLQEARLEQEPMRLQMLQQLQSQLQSQSQSRQRQRQQQQLQHQQPDVHAFCPPGSGAKRCMHCRKETSDCGHRSYSDCPDYRSLPYAARVLFHSPCPPLMSCLAQQGH